MGFAFQLPGSPNWPKNQPDCQLNPRFGDLANEILDRIFEDLDGASLYPFLFSKDTHSSAKRALYNNIHIVDWEPQTSVDALVRTIKTNPNLVKYTKSLTVVVPSNPFDDNPWLPGHWTSYLLAMLERMPNLEFLRCDLDPCVKAFNEILPSMTKLVKVSLRGNGLTDKFSVSWGQLPNLQEITMDGAIMIEFGDEDVSPDCKVKKLLALNAHPESVELMLSSQQFTELRELRVSMPESGCMVNVEWFTEIIDLLKPSSKTLETLQLSGPVIEPESLSLRPLGSISNFTALREISVPLSCLTQCLSGWFRDSSIKTYNFWVYDDEIELYEIPTWIRTVVERADPNIDNLPDEQFEKKIIKIRPAKFRYGAQYYASGLRNLRHALMEDKPTKALRNAVHKKYRFRPILGKLYVGYGLTLDYSEIVGCVENGIYPSDV